MKTTAAFLASVIAAFGGGAATSTPAAPNPCVTITKTLSIGSTGSEVIKLQQFLGVKNSGYFGTLTQQKLIAWQKEHSVIASAKTPGAGTTGPKTRAAMRCMSSLPASPATTSATKPAYLPPTATAPQITPFLPPASVIAPTPPSPQSSGGSPTGCPAFTDPQPTTSCAVGSWEKVIDESGCYIYWECIDPNPQG